MTHLHTVDAQTIKKTVSTYIAEFRSSGVEDISLKIDKVTKENSKIVVTGVYSMGFLDSWHRFEMTFDESLNPTDIKVPLDED